MNPLLKLLPIFESHLEVQTKQITSDLEFLLESESKNTNLKLFNFEYDSDSFIIVFWSQDFNYVTITDTITIPIKDRNDFYKQENYNVKFIPYSLTESEEEIYKFYRNIEDDNKMSEYWEYSEEYFDLKNEIFIKWFISCWKNAISNSNILVEAYLSEHDSVGSLNLNTLEDNTDEELQSISED